MEALFVSAGGTAYAMSVFEKQKEAQPSTKTVKLVNAIMDGIMTYASNSDAVDKIYSSAIEWRDLELWKRVVSLYIRPISNTPYDKIASAVQYFGFSSLQKTCVITSIHDLIVIHELMSCTVTITFLHFLVKVCCKSILSKLE